MCEGKKTMVYGTVSIASVLLSIGESYNALGKVYDYSPEWEYPDLAELRGGSMTRQSNHPSSECRGRGFQDSLALPRGGRCFTANHVHLSSLQVEPFRGIFARVPNLLDQASSPPSYSSVYTHAYAVFWEVIACSLSLFVFIDALTYCRIMRRWEHTWDFF